MALFLRCGPTASLKEEVMRPYRQRYSVQDFERIRREKQEAVKRSLLDYIGGQIRFVQHSRGQESVTILAEIEEISCRGSTCMLKVSNMRERLRDNFGPWSPISQTTELILNLNAVGRIEHHHGRLSFNYIDESPLLLDSCQGSFWPSDAPYEQVSR